MENRPIPWRKLTGWLLYWPALKGLKKKLTSLWITWRFSGRYIHMVLPSQTISKSLGQNVAQP